LSGSRADLGGRGALLALAELDEGGDVGVRIVAALVTPGDDQVAHAGPLVHPAGDGARRAELDVVRMRCNHQHALWRGQLVIRHGPARS
jgi:hypothetical protein